VRTAPGIELRRHPGHQGRWRIAGNILGRAGSGEGLPLKHRQDGVRYYGSSSHMIARDLLCGGRSGAACGPAARFVDRTRRRLPPASGEQAAANLDTSTGSPAYLRITTAQRTRPDRPARPPGAGPPRPSGWCYIISRTSRSGNGALPASRPGTWPTAPAERRHRVCFTTFQLNFCRARVHPDGNFVGVHMTDRRRLWRRLGDSSLSTCSASSAAVLASAPC
jgi:hypothetical protein